MVKSEQGKLDYFGTSAKSCAGEGLSISVLKVMAAILANSSWFLTDKVFIQVMDAAWLLLLLR
jgi:hypothetical protein